MSSANAEGSSKAADSGLAGPIEQAHRCEKLSNLDDRLPYRDFTALWSALSSRWSNRPWMTYYPCNEVGERPTLLTFSEFSDLIDRVTILLADEYSISPGRTIALMTINQPVTAAIYFAAWRLGARVVPVNPDESDERIGAILCDARASLLIVHTTCRDDHEPLDRVLENREREDFQRALVLDGTSRNAALVAGWEDFNVALEDVGAKSSPPLLPESTCDADALLLYPSEGQGELMGAVLTQKQLLAAAYGIAEWHGLDEHAVLMGVLPLYRGSEVIMSLITSAFAGAQFVLNREFTVAGFWGKLAEHSVNFVSVLPKCLHLLLATEEEYAPESISNFRHFICRSQPLAVEAAGEFQDRFGLKIVHGYGLNETACYSCFLPIALEWAEHMEWICDHEVPSVGVPMIVNDVEIQGPEGKPLPAGQKGEIVARGHNIMAGYFNNPPASAAAFRGGWLHSGYQGFKLRGEDGRDYFFITGRVAGRTNS